MDAMGAHVAALTPHQIVAAAVGGAGMAALAYWKANPFPVDNPDGTPETILPTKSSGLSAIQPAATPAAPALPQSQGPSPASA